MGEDIDDEFDGAVITCDNESRTRAVLSTARAVPFKILFIEGMLQSFDGMGVFSIGVHLMFP